MRFKILILFVFGVLSVVCSNGQKFEPKHPKTRNDSQKIIFFNQRAWDLSSENMPSAMKFAQSALELSQKNKFQKGIADSYLNLGILHSNSGNYDKAIALYLNALRIHDSLKLTLETAEDMGSIGILYKTKGDYDKALGYYLTAIKKFESVKSAGNIAAYSSNIGSIYRIQKKYTESLKYLNNALEYYSKANNPAGLGEITNNLALLYWDMGELDKALAGLLNALEIQRKRNNYRQISIVLNNIGGLHLDLAKNKKPDGQIYNPSLSNTSKVNYLKKAKTYLLEAQSLAVANQYTYILQDVYFNLSEISKELNNFKSAYDYYIQYSNLKDSIFSIDKSNAIFELESKFNTEQKNRESQIREQQRLKAIQYRNNLQYSGIMISILILFIILFMAGKFRASPKLVDAMAFVSFLLFFEFVLVFLEPYIDQYTYQVPLYKLAINAGLAIILSPVHEWIEEVIKHKIYKTQKKIIK